ncbi:ATP-binding protein [Duganella sp. CY15W]|uniref:ATP-binding protein n=1 Tax=Duganella sp. CY15W TaxID=2692172 RepID=UPI0013689D49|nr:ATP-binding protein [Duganella sp. CY15W]MYM31501.1 ATP-binding protein [Duganella sp. CY15W]
MKEFSKVLGVDSVLNMLREVPGTCVYHGPSIALLPKNPRSGRTEWYCGVCAEEKRREEDHAAYVRGRNETLYRIANIPQRYRGQLFVAATDRQKQVRATVRAFRDAIVAEQRWAVLMMVGTTGTGKTLLACELAQALIDKCSMSVRYCTASQMISEVQSTYGREGKTEEQELMRLAQYDLLILDEVDAIRSTENSILLLTEIINRRYNAEKPVLVISNQPTALLRTYVGDRVFSRFSENALVCAHDWEDQRSAMAA